MPAEAVVAAQAEQDVMTILAEDEKEEEKEAHQEEDVRANEIVPQGAFAFSLLAGFCGQQTRLSSSVSDKTLIKTVPHHKTLHAVPECRLSLFRS